jgi:hypothetical protein
MMFDKEATKNSTRLFKTYKLIQKAKETGFDYVVNNLVDEQRIVDVIHTRADYQRTGFFYPEVAMYFTRYP